MSRKGEQFAGLTVALVTPFKDGKVDEPALKKIVDFHIEAGTDVVSPVGTTGESPTLTHDEHERVIAVVCEHAAGRIKVMAGTGSNSTAECVRLTKYAKTLAAKPQGLLLLGDNFYISLKPEAVVLDYFAGSGTTAHAVMRLNKQDGGRRQSILVTNNEVAADLTPLIESALVLSFLWLACYWLYRRQIFFKL